MRGRIKMVMGPAEMPQMKVHLGLGTYSMLANLLVGINLKIQKEVK